jgi:hypothetical protein
MYTYSIHTWSLQVYYVYVQYTIETSWYNTSQHEMLAKYVMYTNIPGNCCAEGGISKHLMHSCTIKMKFRHMWFSGSLSFVLWDLHFMSVKDFYVYIVHERLQQLISVVYMLPYVLCSSRNSTNSGDSVCCFLSGCVHSQHRLHLKAVNHLISTVGVLKCLFHVWLSWRGIEAQFVALLRGFLWL